MSYYKLANWYRFLFRWKVKSSRQDSGSRLFTFHLVALQNGLPLPRSVRNFHQHQSPLKIILKWRVLLPRPLLSKIARHQEIHLTGKGRSRIILAHYKYTGKHTLEGTFLYKFEAPLIRRVAVLDYINREGSFYNRSKLSDTSTDISRFDGLLNEIVKNLLFQSESQLFCWCPGKERQFTKAASTSCSWLNIWI